MKVKTEYPSILITRDVYIESFSFNSGDRKIGQGEATAKYRLEFSKTEQDYQIIKIFTEIDASDDCMHLDLVVVGVYDLQDKEKLPEDVQDEVLTRNATAILMPFVRSQISLLTAQPGFMPIVLPPVDINAMVDDFKKSNK